MDPSSYQRLGTWSFGVGRPLFGLPVRVHWVAAFVPLILFIESVGAYVRSGIQNVPHLSLLGGAVFYTVIVYFFVYLHELGHSLAALRCRIPVHGILLWPLGGMAMLGGRIRSPDVDLVVTIFGPVVNLALMALFYFILFLAKMTHDLSGLSLGFTTQNFLQNLFLINAGMAVFNFLPIFPLDGASLLRAGLTYRMGEGRATYATALLGQFLCVPLAVAGFYLGGTAGTILVMIAIWGFFQCEQEKYASQDGVYGDDRSWGVPYPDGYFDEPSAKARPKPGFFARWAQKRREAKRRRDEAAEATFRRDVDEILRKVKELGLTSLTPKERGLLQRASEQYKRKSARTRRAP